MSGSRRQRSEQAVSRVVNLRVELPVWVHKGMVADSTKEALSDTYRPRRVFGTYRRGYEVGCSLPCVWEYKEGCMFRRGRTVLRGGSATITGMEVRAENLL